MTPDLELPLAPYLHWAKSQQPAAIDLAASNLLHCTIDELPGARETLELSAPIDNGSAPLAASIAAHYGVAADRVVPAGGCSGANFLAIAALAGPGDDVLIERPAYDPLIGACRLLRARVVRFERRFESGYAIDLDHIREQITPRTRLIVVTNPHNPSGMILGAEPLLALGRIAAESGASVLVDEVYLDGAMIAAGEPATASTAARLDGPFVVTSSLTKSYGLAGLRCGWAIAGAGLAERMRWTRDVVDSENSAPADRLAQLAFAGLPRLAARTRALLTRNLAVARVFFAAQPAIELAHRPAASVVFPRLEGHADATAFAGFLLERHGVAVVPGRFFEQPAHFRVSLSGRSDALEAGLTTLGAALDAFGR